MSRKAYADIAPPLPEHLTEAYEFSDMRAMWMDDSVIPAKAGIRTRHLKQVHAGKLANEVVPASTQTASHISWVKIKSIEYVGYEQVYDIEVEGTHNFVAGHWVTPSSVIPVKTGIHKGAIPRHLPRLIEVYV